MTIGVLPSFEDDDSTREAEQRAHDEIRAAAYGLQTGARYRVEFEDCCGWAEFTGRFKGWEPREGYFVAMFDAGAVRLPDRDCLTFTLVETEEERDAREHALEFDS